MFYLPTNTFLFANKYAFTFQQILFYLPLNMFYLPTNIILLAIKYVLLANKYNV